MASAGDLMEKGINVLTTQVSPGQAPRSLKEANISGNRASLRTLYGYAWPWTWLANWFGEPDQYVNDKRTQRLVISTFGWVVMSAISLLLVFLFSIIYTCFYGVIRAIFHSVFSTSNVSPLAIGFTTGLIYLMIFFFTRFVGKGYFTTWDTLAAAICGFVGHDRTTETTILSYSLNWLMAVLYIVMQLCGGLAGAAMCDYFVKGSVILGASIPENSLVGRDGPVLFWNLIAAGLFVISRLYSDNPSQLPHSKFGINSGLTVMVVSIIGAYLGNTGAFDLMTPLCYAIIAKKFNLFWALFTGQGIGAAIGLAVFALMALYHSIEQFGTEKGWAPQPNLKGM